jgi:hypothetical protein
VTVSPFRGDVQLEGRVIMKGFEKLDIDSKSVMLQYKGRKLVSVPYYNYRCTLFAFEDALVEEYYDTETKEISRIVGASPHDLKKYLDKIDISDLCRL